MKQLLLPCLMGTLLALPMAVPAEPQDRNTETSPEQTPDAPRWFDIEVVIFAHQVPGDDGERWPREPVLDDSQPLILPADEITVLDRTADTRNITDATAAPSTGVPLAGETEPATAQDTPPAWTHLATEERQLTAMAQSLARARAYALIAHLAWRQIVLDHDRAEAWDIGELLPRPSHAPANPAPLTASAIAARSEGMPSSGHQDLQGTLRVSVARYLHLEADLRYDDATQYAPEVDDDRDGSAIIHYEKPIYRLQERRRMRSEELHYFDHPRFSMLALIRPYTPPEPEPLESPLPVTETNEALPAGIGARPVAP